MSPSGSGSRKRRVKFCIAEEEDALDGYWCPDESGKELRDVPR